VKKHEPFGSLFSLPTSSLEHNTSFCVSPHDIYVSSTTFQTHTHNYIFVDDVNIPTTREVPPKFSNPFTFPAFEVLKLPSVPSFDKARELLAHLKAGCLFSNTFIHP
jgi:hypothetical protein